MKKINLLLGLCSLTMLACQSTPSNQKASNQTAVNPLPRTVVNTNPTPVASVIPAAGSKIGRGTGIVKSVDLKQVAVELDHDEIKGMMPAMEGMMFYAENKSELEVLKPGDKVVFTLEENQNHQEKIIQIAKID